MLCQENNQDYSFEGASEVKGLLVVNNINTLFVKYVQTAESNIRLIVIKKLNTCFGKRQRKL